MRYGVNARKRKVKKVKREIFFCSLFIFFIVNGIILISSFSTQASDLNHQPSYKYYKNIQIQKGDTLWSIANEYADEHYKSKNEYVQEVKRMNNLTSDHIKSGYYLIIPYYSSEFVITSPSNE